MAINKTLYLLQESLPLLCTAALLTIVTAISASLIGLCGGVLFGIAESDKLKKPWLSPFIQGFVLIVRGIPVYVQVLIFYFALPEILGINLSPLAAGIITLGINSIAYVTEIIRGGMNAIPQGQWDASNALGYSAWTTLYAIIMPQVFKIVLPSLTNELIVLLKETSILATIGLAEMTRVGINISAKTLDPLTVYAVIALMYLTLTTTLSFVAKKYEQGLCYDKSH